MRFRLKIPKRKIAEWAARYGDAMDDHVPLAVGATVRERGYLTRAEFLSITHWKSPRTQPRCAQNTEEYVKSITEVALATKDERLAIEVLTLLDGVSWPTASVILHFCSSRSYPILDFRALWSLSHEPDVINYDFSLWWEYVLTTRALAEELDVPMRTLDRALWAYSKMNQPGT